MFRPANIALASIAPPHPPTLPPDGTDIDQCQLFGPTGLVVQACMGIFVLLSLVVKRQLERKERRRSWRIWIWDIGKQLVGQAVVHGLNVLISALGALVDDDNPCSLYFLNVLIDTTVGVGILYFGLKGLTWYFSTYLGMEGFISGQYGKPPRSVFWWKQLIPYLLAIITMKLVVLLTLIIPQISTILLSLSDALLDKVSPRVQVIFVMAIFPLVMTIIQSCLIDQVIKARQEPTSENDVAGTAGTGEGGRYRRLPTWEGDTEQDLEANAQTSPVSSTKSKRMIPTSPLLSSQSADYGSATPSPNGSPSKVANDDNGGIWSRLLSRKPHTAEEVEQTQRWDRLYVDRGRRDRSAAPSPDSFIGEGGTGLGFQDISRLSSSVEREARKTLSPPTSPVVRLNHSHSQQGVNLEDVRGE